MFMIRSIDVYVSSFSHCDFCSREGKPLGLGIIVSIVCAF